MFDRVTLFISSLHSFGRMVALVRKGGNMTTRTEVETAGSGKDLGFWLWPLGAGRCKAAPYAIEGPHPSPAASGSSATVEEPRARKVADRKVRGRLCRHPAPTSSPDGPSGISRRFRNVVQRGSFGANSF
eukprot:scaffold44813_cov62-Phaeocystis_antarctica.AAC.5